MTKMTLKIIVFAGLGLGLVLGACQSGGSSEEKTPLNSQIVRLGDTVVAEIDGTSIFLSDIEHTALAKGAITPGQSLTPKDPVFQTILDELIDQRLLALEALRRSLDQNDETRRRLAVARERILANVVVETLLAEKVTEQSVKRMYAEQSALQSKTEQVRARHIVVKTQEQAQELKALVEQGGSFSALAKEFTIDPSTQDLGGDLGYFSQNAMEDVIAAQAFALETGGISEPFETKYGWHILTTTDRRPMPRPALKTIRSEIVSYMTYEEIQKLLKSLRSASAIELKLGQASAPDVEADKPDAP
ncbi:MAG: peptidylprolyl isomerase [Robiginitomaculum sp.]|nr:MAG: peptidylprolyl isomerase [Robiginitomaculum sp.]